VGVNKVHLVQLLKKKNEYKFILGGSNLDVNTEERRRRRTSNPTQAMCLQKSNGDLQKSRRLGFTFTFHFNVIKQSQSFVSVNTSFYEP
jgi:hypothetical protein